ncbi:MAG: DUF58 domain-containing protein [Pseudomonadota bacterium]
MRPSRRLIMLAVLAAVLSALAAAYGGAVRDAALLVWPVLLAAVGLDFVVSWRSRRLALDVDAPDEMYAGEEGRLRLIAEGEDRGRVDLRLDWPDGLKGPGEARLFQQTNIPFRAARRGVWPLQVLWLRWSSRFKLLEFTPKAPLNKDVAVIPNIRPVQSGAIDVMVRSALFGIKDVLTRGEGSDFHQLKEFSAGMDPGSIDWKRSARSRKLLAKEMRAERNHHVILAVDTGHQMREEIADLPKLDHAINAALATGWAATVGGDLIGLFAFDSRPRLFAPPAAGRGAFARIRAQMAELEYKSVETNPTLALAELNARTPRRSLIIVFTDFVDTTSAELLIENLAVLSRKHVLIFVAMRDPLLEELTTVAPRTMAGVAESVSAGQMRRERAEVLNRLQRLGVIVIDAAPGELTPRLVSAYIDLKAREVI